MKITDFLNYIYNSICIIKLNEKEYGTGFFIELPILSNEKPIKGLITNNHVLNEDYLNNNKKVHIITGENETLYEIEYKNKNNFLFTSELIDITFIQLNNYDIDKIKPHFLIPNERDAEQKDSIIVIQYPKGCISFSHGNIKCKEGFNYLHLASTDYESSGSPLLNNNFKVVGIHKSSKGNINKFVNVAVKYSIVEYAIRTIYNNKDIYGIEGARNLAKILNDDEIKELKRHGLQEKELYNKELENVLEKEKNGKLFFCPIEFDDINSDIEQNEEFNIKFILFYRTNHGWYFSYTDDEKFKKKKHNLDDIKENFKWTIITLDINDNFAYNNIYKIISPKQKTLITWLKLTELKYLYNYNNLENDF